MTPRTLCMIVGSAYSGSSLLTALLDQLVEVNAIGEGRQVYHARTGGPCWHCQSTLDDCTLWRQWDDSPFYSWAFNRVDQPVIVDSSKNPRFCIEETGRTHALHDSFARYDIKAVVLSKTVKEQVASFWKHQNWDGSPDAAWSPAQCVDIYISCYRSYVTALRKHGIKRRFLSYRDLVTRPERTINQLAKWLGIGHVRGDERSHTLGGNPSVIAAVSGNDELAFGDRGRSGYLAGKYDDRPSGELPVRYDNSWPTLPTSIRHAMNQRMRQRSDDLSRLHKMLGHSPLQEQI